jgi:hypothetical protein
VTRKAGQLVLEGASAPAGGVYFSAGDVVHAYCPPRTGVPALYQLLTWQQGRFAFLKDAAPPARTIFDDLQNLLLEGLRRLDEYRAFAGRLPPPGTVLHLARVDGPQADIRLTRSEWQLLSLVTGRRTLEEVLNLAEGSEAEAARTVYGLLVAGLVTTSQDDGWLQAIVPARIPVAEASAGREPPPTVLGNLLLKWIDGARPLAEILHRLDCGERALAQELALLVRTGWVRFRAGEDLYRRYLAL